MWKCASKNIKATFSKGFLRCNTTLSTKAPQDNDCSRLLKFAPTLINHINRYYGCYKNDCGIFSNGKKDKEDPKKRNSFLECWENEVFDVLRLGGAFVLGYYFLQPFTRKRSTSNFSTYENEVPSVLLRYQSSIYYLISVLGIKPFNNVLPVVKATKSLNSEKQFIESSQSESLKPDNDNFGTLEKAHRKVLGALNNWFGTQFMKSGSHEEALKCFVEAAEDENLPGIFNLGICYEKGLGTSRNFKKAAELYQKAADLGHASAMYNLGVFYVQGLGGVEPDMDYARELFKTAASLGQRDAERALNMEKQFLSQLPEDILPRKNILSQKEETVPIPSLICDVLLNKSLNSPESCKNCDVEKKSSKFSTFQYQSSLMNSDSDSGVLDLSPHIDAEVLPA